MKMLSFAKRVTKELLRDPITLFFGLCFPLILIALLSAIQANIPVSLFEIESLTPAMTVFGLSFFSLFSAQLVAKDRESAFLTRMYTTPMTSVDFILGYMLPLVPMAIIQMAISYLFSIVFGFRPDGNTLLSIVAGLPAVILFLSLGLLFGSIMTAKQAGTICGSLLTNLTAWLSGIWFDIELIGGFFTKFANLLPFRHAVIIERAVASGEFSGLAGDFIWVGGYAAACTVLAVVLFLRQSRRH